MINTKTCFVLIAFLAFIKSQLIWAADFKEFQINGKPIPTILAIVNGTNITAESLRYQVETLKMASKRKNKQITPKQQETFVRNSLSQAIEEELLYQKGKDLNIKVDTKTIQKEIDNLQTKFPDYKTFLAALSFQRLSLEKLAKKIERQLTEDEIIRLEIAPHVNVTENEVKAYYKLNKDSFVETKKYK